MKVLRNYKPLVFVDLETLILSKNNILYRYHIPSHSFSLIAELPSIKIDRLLFRFKLIRRILRMGVNTADIYKKKLFLTYQKQFFVIDLETNQLVYQKAVGKGNGPLNFTVIDSTITQLNGFREGLYFGEYFTNANKSDVHIYTFNVVKNELEIVYTFKSGSINHIHHLVLDVYQQCVWILTGDFEGAPALYKATQDFTSVERVVGGTQDYRSCVAFPIEGAIIYATDSQFSPNKLYKLNLTDNQLYTLAEINGPAIFGTCYMSYFLLSTATEPLVGEHIGIKDYFKNKQAISIQKNESHVLAVDERLTVYQLEQNSKDIFPYYLCQLGNIRFAARQFLSPYLVTYSTANKHNDQHTVIRDFVEVKALLKLNN